MEFIQIEQLLNIPSSLPLPDFENYIMTLLERKSDASAALKELDGRLALLQNHIQLLSMYVKQNHLISKPTSRAEPVAYYTKQEVANKFRVSVRTVTNWITDGLEVEEVGGIKRISADALNSFKILSKQKKVRMEVNCSA